MNDDTFKLSPTPHSIVPFSLVCGMKDKRWLSLTMNPVVTLRWAPPAAFSRCVGTHPFPSEFTDRLWYESLLEVHRLVITTPRLNSYDYVFVLQKHFKTETKLPQYDGGSLLNDPCLILHSRSCIYNKEPSKPIVRPKSDTYIHSHSVPNSAKVMLQVYPAYPATYFLEWVF